MIEDQVQFGIALGLLRGRAESRERIEWLLGVLMEAKDSLQWCSGSADFGEGGQARTGWIRGPASTLATIDAALGEEKRDG